MMQINDLPLEILVEILTYIPVERRQSSSWKINSFYEASTHPRFKNDFRLNLRAAHLEEEVDPVRIFEGSQRVFGEVVFHDTTFGTGYEEFLKGICEFAEKIRIKYNSRKIETKDCAAIIGACDHLKTISMELLQGFGVILNANNEAKELFKRGLKHVENLKICGPIEARIESFVEFLEWMPRLKNIDLRDLEVFRSEEKQFYDAFLPYIERHSITLKGVLFQKDYKPENLEKYTRLVNMNVSLSRFSGTALQNWKWSETEYNNFRKFLQSKCQLDELRLNSAQQLGWAHLMEIIKEQKELKLLEVDSFSFFHAVDMGLLHLLPKVESIIFRDSMDHEEIGFPLVNDANLVPLVNNTLNELIVSKFYALYTPTWLNCEFKALNRLEIRDCELEDEHVHLICEKLPLLTDLTLTSALITDFAITGRPRQKSQAPTEKIKTAIIDLQHLKSLALDYDEKITSHAFADLNINSLHSLSLEGCERINHGAIENIVKNCPNIQKLNVNYCNKLKDDSIELICRNLLKLRHLKINELPAVTERVFEKVGNAATCLQFLHMKDYVKIKNREELARGLFKKLYALRIVKLGLRHEIHRNDVI